MVVDGKVKKEVKDVPSDLSLAKFREHDDFTSTVGSNDVEFIRLDNPVATDSEENFNIGSTLVEKTPKRFTLNIQSSGVLLYVSSFITCVCVCCLCAHYICVI